MIAGRFLTLLSTVLASVKFASADVVDARGLEERAADPCATIGGKTWVSPADVRACYQSFPVDEAVKANVSVFSLSPFTRMYTPSGGRGVAGNLGTGSCLWPVPFGELRWEKKHAVAVNRSDETF